MSIIQKLLGQNSILMHRCTPNKNSACEYPIQNQRCHQKNLKIIVKKKFFFFLKMVVQYVLKTM